MRRVWTRRKNVHPLQERSKGGFNETFVEQSDQRGHAWTAAQPGRNDRSACFSNEGRRDPSLIRLPSLEPQLKNRGSADGRDGFRSTFLSVLPLADLSSSIFHPSALFSSSFCPLSRLFRGGILQLLPQSPIFLVL